MRRRAFFGVLAIIALMLLTTGSALALLGRHTPAFYERAAISDSADRDCHCREFFHRGSELLNMLGGDRPSEQQFTQDQFNSYFQQQEQDGEVTARLVEIPSEIRDIRVAFEDDLIRVGFQYGEGWLACVVSVEFRAWLVAHKTNVIALELCDFRAGAIPLGTRSLIDFITEAARRQNIDVTWFRHRGHPIALLQLQAYQSRPTFQLRRLDVQTGKLIVASAPTRDATPLAAPASPVPVEPLPAARPTH